MPNSNPEKLGMHCHVSCWEEKQEWKVTGLLLIPLVSLVVISAINIHSSLDLYNNMDEVGDNMEKMVNIGNLVSLIHIERDISAIYAGFDGVSNMTQSIAKAQSQVDESLKEFDSFAFYNVTIRTMSQEELKIALSKCRLPVSIYDIPTIIDQYSSLTRGLQLATSMTTSLPDLAYIWQVFVAFDSLLQAQDTAGIIRALGARILASCDLNTVTLSWFSELFTQETLLIQQAFRYWSRSSHIVGLQNETNAMKLSVIQGSIIFTCQNRSPTERHDASLAWFDLASNDIQSIIIAREEAGIHITKELEGIKNEANHSLFLNSFIMVVICLVCAALTCWYGCSIKRMTSRSKSFAKLMTVRTQELTEEKHLSDHLLYQMLPKSAVDQLRQNRQFEIEVFEDVTVLFSDIVGFMTICANFTSMELVSVLNSLYCMFDNVIDRYDAYKVESRGDSYMVASGAPIRNGSQHVKEIALMSLDLLREISDCHIVDKEFVLRIGIHTGSCIAGVLGKKKPHYCLYGDTVNIASRMESTGEASKIHISEATKELLDTHKIFSTTLRGNVHVKGVGDMVTYWLTGVK